MQRLKLMKTCTYTGAPDSLPTATMIEACLCLATNGTFQSSHLLKHLAAYPLPTSLKPACMTPHHSEHRCSQCVRSPSPLRACGWHLRCDQAGHICYILCCPSPCGCASGQQVVQPHSLRYLLVLPSRPPLFIQC